MSLHVSGKAANVIYPAAASFSGQIYHHAAACGKPHYLVSFRTAIGIDLKSMLPRNSNDASGDIYRNIYFVLTTFSDSIPSLLLYEKTRWIASPPGKILLN